MNNYISKGDVQTLVAPYDVASGAGALVGSIFGVAVSTLANGATGEFCITGVFDIAKDASTFTNGALAYWDDTAKKVTSTSTSNKLIGVVSIAQASGTNALGAATGDATVRVRLNGAMFA